MANFTVNIKAKQVIAHFSGLSSAMNAKISKIMDSELGPAKEKAREIIRVIVYSRPENELLRRSYNLWSSVETAKKSTKGQPSFFIFNDPAKATNPYPWVSRKDSSWSANLGAYSGPEKYYPLYVAQGNFFGKKVSIKNFYEEWMSSIAAPLAVKMINGVGEVMIK